MISNKTKLLREKQRQHHNLVRRYQRNLAKREAADDDAYLIREAHLTPDQLQSRREDEDYCRMLDFLLHARRTRRRARARKK